VCGNLGAAPILIGMTAIAEPGPGLRHALDLAPRLTPRLLRWEQEILSRLSAQKRKDFTPVLGKIETSWLSVWKSIEMAPFESSAAYFANDREGFKCNANASTLSLARG
jgi:hypothetical protein